MTTAAFVDVDIPIYAPGGDQRYKDPCGHIIRDIAVDPTRYITDADVLQEVVYHYLRTDRWAAGWEVLRWFETVLRGRIGPVYPDEVLEAALLAHQVHATSSKDLVHASVMRRLGTNLVISADSDFGRIPGVRRLDPMRLIQWQGEKGGLALMPSRKVPCANVRAYGTMPQSSSITAMRRVRCCRPQIRLRVRSSRMR